MFSRFAGALVAATLASPAFAQTRAEVSYLYSYCRAEYHAACGAASPHSLNGRACFRQKARAMANRNQLSRPCIASLRAVMSRYQVE